MIEKIRVLLICANAACGRPFYTQEGPAAPKNDKALRKQWDESNKGLCWPCYQRANRA